MSLRRRAALGFLCLVVSSTWLSAQPPKGKEEEEEPAKGTPRPVVPVPVEEGKKDKPGADTLDPDVGTMKEELAKAKNALARDMFRALLFSHDRLTPNFPGAKTIRIMPYPKRELPDEEFEVEELSANLQNIAKTRTLTNGSGLTFIPYEFIVIEQVEQFLDREKTLAVDRRLEYAARCLTAGLRKHHEFVDKAIRTGKGWDEVGRLLKAKLVETQRKRLGSLVAGKEFIRAEELGATLLTYHPDNLDIKRDVYGLHLLRQNASTKPTEDADLLKLREALLLYEKIPGNKDEVLVANSRRKLRERASALVSEAKVLDEKKMAAASLSKLRQAEAIDPDVPGLDAMRGLLKGKVLYVAVPKLPRFMSPARAESDADRWAVELMFEGLLETVPDTQMIRYRPELADSLPAVQPLARTFTLPSNIRWSNDKAGFLDARDVRETLDLLRKPGYRERWCSDGTEVFHGIDRIENSFALRLAYNRGVIEPLGRATFKVLPARYLKELGKAADDEQFAQAPIGTGPFKFDGFDKEGGVRDCAVFRANPFYGQRTGRAGLPWVREIRFFVPEQSRVTDDVTRGQFQFYPDAPPEMAARFRDDPALKESMRVHTAAMNRRVHILAVNHANTILQSDKLRQGLSMAINRDQILNELFRPGNEKAHAAMTGPFPIKSWATPPTARDVSLFKPGARGVIDEALAGRTVRLRLAYSIEDLKAVDICQRIKAQIEQASTPPGGKPTVQIDLQGLVDRRFRDMLHLEHGYELALTTFDYSDDLYSLAGLLDPEATGRNGRNYLSYLANGTNPVDADRRLRRLVEEARSYRDFNKQVRDKTWDIHNLFNQRLPFIPLWQLDRFMVVHRDLELFLEHPESPVLADRLDPATVFNGVEMWKLRP